MYWARIVAGIYAILVCIFALMQIGNISFSFNISTSLSTAAPDLATTAASTTVLAANGLVVAGEVFSLVGVFAFVPSLLAFNKLADVGGDDDSLVSKRVLVFFRVWLGFAAAAFGGMMAGFILSGTTASYFSALYIADTVVAGLLAVLSVLLMFCFKAEPLKEPVVRTNKVTWFSLSFSVMGISGVLAGAVLRMSLADTPAVAWVTALVMSTYFPVVIVPLWLKFRNDHGGMSKSHAVLGCLSICFVIGASFFLFGDAAASLGTAVGGISIGYMVGYCAFIISGVLNLIQVIRQRKAFVAGYDTSYSQLQPPAPEDKDTAPLYQQHQQPPPSYQQPYHPPVTAPAYQDDYHKAPQQNVQYVAPPAAVAYPPPPSGGALFRAGEFEYDKRNN